VKGRAGGRHDGRRVLPPFHPGFGIGKMNVTVSGGVVNRPNARTLALVMLAVSLAMLIAATLISLLPPGDTVGTWVFVASIFSFPLVGGLIATRRSDNRIGWILLLVGFSFGVSSLAQAWTDRTLVVRPGSLPFGGFSSWLAVWTWGPAILGLFTFLLLLFPDGHLPSPRWRPVLWLSWLSLALMTVPMAIAAWPVRGRLLTRLGESAPPSAPEAFKIAFNVQVAGILLMFLLGIASAVSLLLRLRRSRGDEREQLKWFAFAALVVVVVVILVSPLFGIPDWIQVLAFPLIPIASAVAILKYRLYDIDVVINKTLVVGALAVFITLVYLAVVVGVGALVGAGGRPNAALSIAATAIVAVAFQPLRERARRFANRVVYGRRATPYEVLSEFSGRMGESLATEDVLPRTAVIVGQGTGATRSEVWLRLGGELHLEAAWPEGRSGERSLRLVDGEPPSIPGAALQVPVRHRGELLGALAIAKPSNDPVSPAERKLVEDLAAQAGLVLRNVALISELRASRQRLVRAQDEERRKLERNLHDGAQQQLVALSVQVRLAQSMVGSDDDRARAMLDDVQTSSQAALEDLRDLARGIYPPLLADKGLAAAIEAQARKAPVPVSVEPDGVARYSQDVESAVYFCVLEALNNVSKYAAASHVIVRLGERDGRIRFEVTDDGRGFDPSTATGTGLQGMADRLDAIGGEITVSSALGRGTSVTGEVPLPP
jgi:signal transduction histidine kinase